MSLELTLARIADIQRSATPSPTSIASAAAPPSFATVLESATDQERPGQSQGAAAASIAAAEVGQREAPAGSNDSSRIAEYRRSVPGGPVGPWCAYFASWVSARAGVPLGERGQGFARVDDVWSWAQRTGRVVAPGGAPQAGDLVIWNEHMGVVESVGAGGVLTVVEGNSSDAVSRRTYRPDAGGALGFVRPGDGRVSGPEA